MLMALIFVCLVKIHNIKKIRVLGNAYAILFLLHADGFFSDIRILTRVAQIITMSAKVLYLHSQKHMNCNNNLG